MCKITALIGKCTDRDRPHEPWNEGVRLPWKRFV